MEVEHVFPLQQSVKAGAEQHVPSLDVRQRSRSCPATARPHACAQGVDERTRRMMLVETFGSKKRQREQRSRQANAVDAERVVASGAISNILAKNSVVAIKDNVAAATEAAAGSTAGNGAPRAALHAPLPCSRAGHGCQRRAPCSWTRCSARTWRRASSCCPRST